MAALRFDTTADNSNVLASFKGIRDDVRKTAHQVEQNGMSIEQMFNRIQAAAGITLSIAGVKDFVSKVTEVRAYFQDIESSMATFLGNAEKAADFTEKLKKYAYYNMFDFKDLATASQQMIAYHTAVEDVIPILDRLSNIATGTKTPLMELVNMYNNAKSVGYIATNQLAMWARQGILVKETLKEMGEEVPKTGVTFEQLNMVIEKMTDEGGMFCDLMLSQMNNLSAEQGQLQDELDGMFNEIGEKWQDVLKGGIDIEIWMVEHYKEIAKVLGTVVAAYGAYKGALMLCWAWEKASLALGTAKAFFSLAKEVRSAKDAMLLFNMATKASPIGLIASLVGAAAAAFHLFSEDTSQAAQMTKKYGENASNAITRIKNLSTTLNGLTKGSTLHKQIMEELNGVLEQYGIAAVQEGDSIDSVNEKREKAISLIKEEAIERERLNNIAQGDENYQTATDDARGKLLEDLKGAMTGSILLSGNKQIQENAQAISTIISNIVESEIDTIADKSGDEYEKALDKIFKTIQQRMLAIGIDAETVESAWMTDDLFNHQNLVLNYIKTLKSAKEEHNRYTDAVEKSAEAEREAAQASTTYGDRVAAIESKLQGPNDSVHTLYTNIKDLMSEYSTNTIGFTIRIGGEVPAWMEKMDIPELQQLAKRFTALGRASKNGAVVNGKKMSQQELLQRGADYATAAEKKQNAADAKAKEEERKAEERKKAAEKAAKEAERNAADAANRRQKESEEQARLDEQMTNQHLAALQARAQADIAQIENAAERERAEAEQSHKERLQQIADHADEYKKALYEHNKAVWENNNKDKNAVYTDTAEGKAGWEGLKLTADQQAEIQALIDKENIEYRRGVRDRYKQEAQAMREYLKTYGSFEQQKLAIAEEYEQKIKDASSEGERLMLAKQQKEAEAKLSYENISMGIDWKALFSGVGNLNKQMLQPIMDQLKAYTETDEYKQAGAETQEKIADLISELRGYIGTDHSVTWQTLETAMSDFTSSVDKYNEAVLAEKDAVALRNQAKVKLSRGEISQEEYDRLAEEADRLGNETAKAKESMSLFAKSLNNTTDEIENYTSKFAVFLNKLKGLDGLEGGSELKDAIESIDSLKGDLDATLAGMKDGVMKDIGNSISSAIGDGMNFIGDGLTSILGEGVGSMVMLVAQIPKLILQVVGSIKSMITGVLDSVTELVSLRWIDDLVVSILDAIGNVIDAILDLPENIAKVLGSILEGVGGLVEGIVGRVANIVTLGRVDSNFISNWLFGDDSKYEDALDKWGWLLDSWEDNLEYEKELMEKAYGGDLLTLQKQSEKSLKNTQKAAAEIYKGWAGSGAGLFSHSNGVKANEGADWGILKQTMDNETRRKLVSAGVINSNGNRKDGISSLFNMDWKDLEKLKFENAKFWQSLHSTAQEYLDQYIEAGRAIEEVQKSVWEKLTTTTSDDVFSGFLDQLYDLADGSEDVFDDIAKGWQEMVNKMVINNLVATKFQKNLEGWYERLAKLNEARNNGTKTNKQYQDELDALQREYEGYVKSAQSEIEQFRDMGIIKGSQDNTYTQEASSKGFQAMGQDTADELNGRFTALQISNETIASAVLEELSMMNALSSFTAERNRIVEEIRELVFTQTGYLEDIVKYAKLTYVKLGGKLDDIIENTKNS